jgi:hypothetical protein
VAAFVDALPQKLGEVGDRLRTGQGPIGRFRDFTIHDPKERLISAPCFEDRVLHHAVMNVCEPVFERWLIRQTFACRTGLGLRAAIREAARWTNRFPWYLQMDVKHYFETVPRNRLLKKLTRIFGEVKMLQLWDEIIHSHHPERPVGMPIGALTSQHLANYYLGFLDRFVKESLRIPAYARYMDDVVLWHTDKGTLLRCRDRIGEFVTGELGLALKPPVLNRTAGGMDFIGFRFQPGWVGLNRRSRRRLRLKLRAYAVAWADGQMTEDEMQRRTTACLAFAAPAKTRKLRRSVVRAT